MFQAITVNLYSIFQSWKEVQKTKTNLKDSRGDSDIPNVPISFGI